MTGQGGLPAAEAARLADLIAAEVTSCPAVTGLADAPGGPVATYLPGRIVYGVAVRPGEVEVCVTAGPGLPLPQVAAQVRQAVTPLVPGWTVDVVIGDITLPGPQDRASRP
jgi:hypothetical protein